MKALIWFLTILIACTINVLLGTFVGFRIGYLLLYIAVYFIGKSLCEKWDEHIRIKELAEEMKKDESSEEASKLISEQMEIREDPSVVSEDAKIEMEGKPIQYCRFCGKKLMTDSTFCGYCGKKLVE